MIQMASLLRDSGEFEVHVAALRGGGVLRSEIDRLQIPVIEFPLTSFYNSSMVQQTRRFVSYLKQHDIKIVQKLAWVMCGGDLTGTQQVTEQYLLDLEREAFLSLCGEQKTMERIQYMLENGKPLRN